MSIRPFFLNAAIGLLLCAASAGAQRAGSAVPDVYVGAGNSFVITVPNLSKVAVGNPTVLLANVISPTEVLIQGAPEVAKQGDGILNYALSNLYVWSGDRRYMYRVVVIETTDTSLQSVGINRIDVEPDRVVLHGLTTDVRAMALTARGLESLGIRIENKVQAIDLERMAAEDRRLDSATVAAAISNRTILVGMNRDELLAVRGEPIRRPTLTIQETVTGQRRFIEEFDYADMRVQVADGFVEKIMSHVSPDISHALERVTVQSASDGTGPKMELRLYKLRYAEPQEIVTLLRAFLSADGKFVANDVSRTVLVEESAARIEMIDQIMRVMDSPRFDHGVSIMRTKYIDGTGKDRTSEDIVTSKEIMVIGLGAFLDAATRERVGAELERLGQRIFNEYVAQWRPEAAPPWAFRLIRTTNSVVVIGPPGILDVLAGFASANLVTASHDDIRKAIENGELMPGMTREQVEIALKGARATGAPHRIESSMGTLWEYQYADYICRFRNEQLYQILLLPTAAQLEQARENRVLLWGMSRAQVEEVLLEQGEFVPSTRLDRTMARYIYRSGSAIFRRERLEEFLPSPEANVIVSGSLTPVSGGLGNVYGRMSAADRRNLIEQRKVVPGMALADVFAMQRGVVPFVPKPEIDADGRTLWKYVYPGQTILVENGLVVGVNEDGQKELTTRILPLVSRNAETVRDIVRAMLNDTEGLKLEADTVTNSILVTASFTKIAEINQLVMDLERTPARQVLIEAKFVELNRNVARQLGVQWGLSTQASGGNRPTAGFSGVSSVPDISTPPNTTLLTGTPGATTSQQVSMAANSGTSGPGLLLGMLGGSGFSFSGLRYTNVDILISAMESTGDANVLSSPRIVTLNNQKAILKSIDRVYDVRTIQTTDANGLVTFSTELDPKEVGITLDVNPTIGQDGMISLGLDATVSRVMERRNYGVGTNVIIVNEISERKSNSRVMVRSGAPLVIGGLSSRDIRSNNQQVPILGSIPILGRLFRSDRKTATDLDLLIFLTARIVPPDGGVSEIETLLEQPRPVVPNPPPPVVETAPPVTRR
jgi:type II secretory pathway component GspD/PulD (secretin)